MAEPVRGHEGRGGQETQGVGAENARLKRIVADQALDDVEGVGRGKMVTPERRRIAVATLVCRFGVSERRACRVVGQHRSTQRRHRRPRPDLET